MQPSPIAIVGMSGRFPGARNLSAFWRNLRDGVESIRGLTDAELRAKGVSPDDLANPAYVKRAAILDDVSMFDAGFFGFSPRDASIMDPQHRQFLECAWEAFEDAGHPPRAFEGSIGVFAGSGMNTYLIHNLLANHRLRESAGLFQLKQTGNDKDVLATRVSYQLDLRGPSINVQTACSTSLVAVHLACQSLLNFECDMALAGGMTIEIPHGVGYVYRDGEILSRDGHCRSFDAKSSGTVFASGLGVVVLRRLEEAIEDGDQIHAVILGSAINNDGARKIGYLAPSVEGQAEVIAEALGIAGISADEISYVETHGTGTVVGDPIEVRALTQAFRATSSRKGYCGIGSLKSNVGHLDAAAGVAGLIKVVLAMENGRIPASLHFQTPNPHIAFADSPFYVNTILREWTRGDGVRRAGVTSLGIGGTNAHVILEEPPAQPIARSRVPYELLVISAKTSTAADQALTNLAAHLREHPNTELADAAFTLQIGRESYAHRRALVVANVSDAIGMIESRDRITSGAAKPIPPQVVFLFSGQGSQYVNMGRNLYENEAIFRDALDECAHLLLSEQGIDLLRFLFPSKSEKEDAEEKLNQTWLTQPALFSIEYALARWWIAQGVEPAAMVGHSIGEYVAACIAGVFSLADALSIVVLRGRLIYDLPPGCMLAVMLPPDEINLSDALSLAAVNHPRQSVISGPTLEIEALERTLAAKSVGTRRLQTSHAFHSSMMEPILSTFEERLHSIQFQRPSIPYMSNISGTWIKAEEATDPAYWSKHIRQTVLFAACLEKLNQKKDQVLLEVGPGTVLASLARQQSDDSVQVLQSLPHPRESKTALECALDTLGALWVSGARVTWTNRHSRGAVQRISLPTYPFERQEYWIEPDPQQHVLAAMSSEVELGASKSASWIYRRSWKKAPLPKSTETEPGCWIVFRDSSGLSDKLIRQLTAERQDVVLVDAGPAFKQARRSAYTIQPGVREDYDALLAQVIKEGFAPRRILHLWSVTSPDQNAKIDDTLQRSFFSPLYLAQALGAQDMSGIDIAFVSSGLQKVEQESVYHPERAVLLGPARVIPRELPGIICRSLDIELTRGGVGECAGQILAEMKSVAQPEAVAFRSGERWTETFDRIQLDGIAIHERLEVGGVYLITGGLGGLGLVIAERLAKEFHANLVLIGRTAGPETSQWEQLLQESRVGREQKERIRSLIEIQKSAASLCLEKGDVADPQQMREVVAATLKRFGRIDGVFHAAGVLDDGPLMYKTAAIANTVLEPKVQGTLALEAALKGVQVRCFVLFSSISSILPPPGQVDYAAANAFLDAFALSRGEPVRVINWGAWRDVGMAARSGSRHPLLQKSLLDTSLEIAYTCSLSPREQWLLSDHKLKSGKSLLPGTAYLEMAIAAFAHGSVQSAVELSDVFFLSPFACGREETREIQVHLTREGSSDAEHGGFKFSVVAANDSSEEFASGRVGPCVVRPQNWVDAATLAKRCQEY